MRTLLTAGLLIATMASSALGQIVVPGADGSDGAFNPTSNVSVDLSLAPNGTWNGPNASPGNGVYDPDKWAIVFRYSSVNIPVGVTVSFLNRNWNGLKSGNPPVIWIVSGPVIISGIVSANGDGPDSLNFGIPGPGGFRGAGNNGNTGGMGPGGSTIEAIASFGQGSNQYGNSRSVPLIGGSGAGSHNGFASGGGGAILITATGTIEITGQISANSTGIRGSGGAIRLVCNRIQGNGTVRALGSSGNAGRIRLESNQLAFGDSGQPQASFGLPGATAQIWPEDVTSDPPTVRVVSLSSIPIPADPAARFDFPAADLNVTNGSGQQLLIEAKNIPTGSDPPGVQAWNVVARVVPRGSAPFTVNATLTSGNYTASNWTATINMPNGFSAVQVRASMPPQ